MAQSDPPPKTKKRTGFAECDALGIPGARLVDDVVSDPSGTLKITPLPRGKERADGRK